MGCTPSCTLIHSKLDKSSSRYSNLHVNTEHGYCVLMVDPYSTKAQKTTPTTPGFDVIETGRFASCRDHDSGNLDPRCPQCDAGYHGAKQPVKGDGCSEGVFTATVGELKNSVYDGNNDNVFHKQPREINHDESGGTTESNRVCNVPKSEEHMLLDCADETQEDKSLLLSIDIDSVSLDVDDDSGFEKRQQNNSGCTLARVASSHENSAYDSSLEVQLQPRLAASPPDEPLVADGGLSLSYSPGDGEITYSPASHVSKRKIATDAKVDSESNAETEQVSSETGTHRTPVTTTSVNKTYEEWWQHGRTNGWQQGRESGWQDGRQDGWQDGWHEGYHQGYHHGFRQGWEARDGGQTEGRMADEGGDRPVSGD